MVFLVWEICCGEVRAICEKLEQARTIATDICTKNNYEPNVDVLVVNVPLNRYLDMNGMEGDVVLF